MCKCRVEIFRYLELVERRHQGSRGEKTANWYGSVLKIVLEHEPIANAFLDDIDSAAVDAYAQHRSKQAARFKNVKRKLQPTTINCEIATIPRMVNVAAKWNVIDHASEVEAAFGEQHREFILHRQDEANYVPACPQPCRRCRCLCLTESNPIDLAEQFSTGGPTVLIKDCPAWHGLDLFSWCNHAGELASHLYPSPRQWDGSWRWQKA